MRPLNSNELTRVAGGSTEGWTPPPVETGRRKNNNGYGNGAESGPAPGNSGATGGGKNANLGPRGPR